MIRVRDISFSYTGSPVYQRASFTLGQGQKAGFVGPNGAGKSTLFKLLLGIESPNEGKIEITGTIGFVPQEVKKDAVLQESKTIKEYIDPEKKKENFELMEILTGLELSHLSLSQSPKELSGGQKTKLALARAFIQQPDVLLLDEPTNFLDTDGKKWVMHFLSTYPKTLLMVSHDLSLLDRYIDKVIVVNPFTHGFEEYTGTYSDYKRLKKEADALLKRNILKQQKHITHMEEAVEKARANKSKKGVRQRVALSRRLERMKENLPEMPKELQKIKIQLPEPARSGEIPIKAVGITKSYGDSVVLEDINFFLHRGERLAIIGHNGAGKSTLLKILMGILPPDSGEVIKDTMLKIGYYAQEFESFDENLSVLNFVKEKVAMDTGKIRGFLARFLFDASKINQPIATLSGGEKTRLAIALLMLHDYNLLILDEPTTYLDPLSQRIILEALKDYKGSMLIVSHTQEFIQELEPKRALLLPENELLNFSPDLLEKVSEI